MTDEAQFRETVLLRLKSIDYAVSDCGSQIATQNGRVGKLEGAELMRQLRDAEVRGAANAHAVITMGQLTKLGTVVAVVSGVVGLATRLL